MFHLFHPSALGGFEGRIKRSVERDTTRVSRSEPFTEDVHNVVKAMEQTSFDKVNSILPLPRLGQSSSTSAKWRSDILVLPHPKLSPPSSCSSYIRRFFYDRANYLRGSAIGCAKGALRFGSVRGCFKVTVCIRELDDSMTSLAAGRPVSKGSAVGRSRARRPVLLSAPSHDGSNRIRRLSSAIFLGPVHPPRTLRHFLHSLNQSNCPALHTSDEFLVSRPGDASASLSGDIDASCTVQYCTGCWFSGDLGNGNSHCRAGAPPGSHHITCYGILEPEKPESMPRYRGGVRLSLLDNVRSRVPKAELFNFNNEICFTCGRTYGILLRSA
jgi:hypothetical protein